MRIDETSRFWLGFVRHFGGTLLGVFFFLRATGTRHVPRTGPVIIAPNHESYLDPPVVAMPLPRVMFYMAWVRLFDVQWFGRFIWKLGARPVDPASPADIAAYRTSLELLKAGGMVCIFPEGARNMCEGMLPLKPGVARLALASGAKVVPVWIEGTGRAWPRWRKLPRPFVPVRVRYFPAIDPAKIAPGKPHKVRCAILARKLERVLKKAERRARNRP